MLEFNGKNTTELIKNLNENVDWIIKDRAKQISNRVTKREFVALEKRNTNLKLKLKENLRKLQELQELNKIENHEQISRLLKENKELKEEIDIYTTPVQNILAASPPIFLFNNNDDDNNDYDDDDNELNILIKSQSETINKLKKEVNRLKKDLEENQLIIVDLETLKSEIENLKNINDNLQNDNLQNKNLNLAEINYLKQELKKFEEIEYEKQKLQNNLKKKNRESLNLKNEIEKLQLLLQELTSQNEELIIAVTELNLNLNIITQKEKNTSRILFEQKNSNSSLNFSLADKDKEILKKQEKISQLEKNNKSLRDTFEDKDSKIKLLNENNTNLNKDLELIKLDEKKVITSLKNIEDENIYLKNENNEMYSRQERLNSQIKTLQALETENEQLKKINEQLETWNDEQNQEQKDILEHATILFNENNRLSLSKKELEIELFARHEMLETFEKKIEYYNHSITQILINPEKKSILIRICDKYNKIYNKGIACNSRKTSVINILETLLRIDKDNNQNTIEEEITKGFKIEMYGSAN